MRSAGCLALLSSQRRASHVGFCFPGKNKSTNVDLMLAGVWRIGVESGTNQCRILRAKYCDSCEFAACGGFFAPSDYLKSFIHLHVHVAVTVRDRAAGAPTGGQSVPGGKSHVTRAHQSPRADLNPSLATSAPRAEQHNLQRLCTFGRVRRSAVCAACHLCHRVLRE